MKPFLILQLRPETPASDSEFTAILNKAKLTQNNVLRIRLDQNPDMSHLNLTDFSGIIVGGGPGCVSDPIDKKPPQEKAIEDACLGIMNEITKRDIPFLGCCYGIGILAHHLGGVVNKEKYFEPVGAVDCSLTQAGIDDDILANVSDKFRSFVGHKEAVQELPDGCTHLVASDPCPYQMIRYKNNVYATQFHPEADPDEFELRINIYRERGYFPPDDADKLIEMIRAESINMPELILQNFVKKYSIE